jgi:hypothetical protein
MLSEENIIEILFRKIDDYLGKHDYEISFNRHNGWDIFFRLLNSEKVETTDFPLALNMYVPSRETAKARGTKDKIIHLVRCVDEREIGKINSNKELVIDWLDYFLKEICSDLRVYLNESK